MTFGLTEQGFVAMRLADVLSETQADFKNAFGINIDLSVDGPFGQLIGILAERQTLLWELCDQLWQSRYPTGSIGVGLDQLYKLINIQRLPAKATTVQETIVGVAGTILPAGSEMETSDTGIVFETEADFEIPVGGTGTVEFVAQETGPKLCLTGTLTVIRTPVVGWTSGTNVEDGDVGRDVEKDAGMHTRRLAALSTIVSSSIPGVLAAVLRLDDVIEAKCITNDSGGVVDGRPSHSYEVVVRGGDDTEIAQSLFSTKPNGIETVGTTTEVVTDAHGDGHDVNFSRPTEVEIYFDISLTVDATFPTDGVTQVRNAVLLYGENLLKMGQTVAPFPIEQTIETPGIVIFDMKLGVAANPTDSNPLEILPTELAVFDSARLTVTVL